MAIGKEKNSEDIDIQITCQYPYLKDRIYIILQLTSIRSDAIHNMTVRITPSSVLRLSLSSGKQSTYVSSWR